MTPNDLGEWPPDTVIGNWRIEQKIGEGGMARVFAARHLTLPRRAAIKNLQLHYCVRPIARERFGREGNNAFRVRHPNVVEIYDVGEHPAGGPYIVMEFLVGDDLQTHLKSVGGPLSPSDAVEILLPVCAGIAAAHDQAVVHRDLKPSNIVLARTDDGLRPVIVDFGIASAGSSEQPQITDTNEIVGTPMYMAPEQARSARSAGPASDQYALGVVLYECVTGHSPFQGDSNMSVLLEVVQGHFERPTALRPELPPSLEAVILRAMSTEPDARFPSMREFAGALLPFATAPVRARWAAEFSDPPRTNSRTPPPRTAPESPNPAQGRDEAGGERSPPPSRAFDSLSETPRPVEVTQRPGVRLGALVALALACLAGLFLVLHRAGNSSRDAPPVPVTVVRAGSLTSDASTDSPSLRALTPSADAPLRPSHPTGSVVPGHPLRPARPTVATPQDRDAGAHSAPTPAPNIDPFHPR